MRRRTVVLAGIVVLVALVLFGSLFTLNGGGGGSGAAYHPLPGVVADQSESNLQPQAPPAPSEDDFKPAQAAHERIIIKNATLRIVVDKPEDSLRAVSRLADQMGGW